MDVAVREEEDLQRKGILIECSARKLISLGFEEINHRNKTVLNL